MRQNTEPEAPPEKRAGSFRFPVALFERLEAEAGAVGQAETAPRGEL